MGVAGDLGYAYPPRTRLHRLVQAFAASRVGAWLTPRTLVPMDAFATKVSRGRFSLPVVLAGLPVLTVETRGRRSGLTRSTHLIAVPFQDTLALMGTNFGQPSTPSWVLNLEAHPEARVSYRGATCAVRARPADSVEAQTILATGADLFAGTARYDERIRRTRRLRVFVLEPA
jgi:deazaflavin-dependent oxidoreductase (nitroreductase family)